MGLWSSFKKGAKELWKELDKVPKCPACHGTGEPTSPYKAWADTVIFKGKSHQVCHNCKGSGYV